MDNPQREFMDSEMVGDSDTPSPDFAPFGFERVEVAAKQEKVDQVFDTVSDRYDLMNDLMSLGLHREW